MEEELKGRFERHKDRRHREQRERERHWHSIRTEAYKKHGLNGNGKPIKDKEKEAYAKMLNDEGLMSI